MSKNKETIKEMIVVNTTSSFEYSKNGVTLKFSLSNEKDKRDFIELLKKAIEDITKSLE